jgi:hypothetical protein
MTLGEFSRNLKKLNSNLRIFAKDTGKPAGINLLFDNEYVSICSIDKNEIPMDSIRDQIGRYIKGGWRRALKVLIDRRLVSREKAEHIFNTRLQSPNPAFNFSADPVMKQLHSIRKQRINRGGTRIDGRVGFKRDDILEMASVVRAARG